MPSFKSLALAAAGSAQIALGLRSPVSRLATLAGASEVCTNPQLSCHNTTAVQNLCCFNSPGGLLLQTQFWDTNPASGPDNSWTIHGLWPDNCDGTYQQYCDPAREYTNITAILKADGDTTLLDYMDKYWTSNTGSAESFWEHEWGKHGTCISTFDPKCYADYQPTEEVPGFFNATVNLFKTLPSYTWLSDAGIVPSTSKTYTLSEIESALSKHHNNKSVYLGCANTNQLDEIWYYFNVQGSIQTGTFVPAAQSGSTSCPATGIKYLPKGSSSSPTSSTTSPTIGPTSTSTSTSTPTGSPFSGKGYLNVNTSGNKKGCIISYGTWYASGTCATFSAAASGSGFTLTSSKGDCAVQNGQLACSADITEPSVFAASGGNLAYRNTSTFHADAVPSGSTQETVYTAATGHGVPLTIEWQSV